MNEYANGIVLGKGLHRHDGNLYFSDIYGNAVDCETEPKRDKRIREGLIAPNGIAVTPDGKTLIVADTFSKVFFAFVLDENGTLHGRRLWAKLSSGPDGIFLDEEECVWAALPNERKVARIEEDGKILENNFAQRNAALLRDGRRSAENVVYHHRSRAQGTFSRRTQGFRRSAAKKASRIVCVTVGVSGAGAP